MTTTEFNEADLPELPEEFRRCSEGGTAEYLDQIAGGASRDDAQRLIRAFALAAVAASRKKLMEQPAVAYRSSEQYSPDVGSWFEYYDQYREINDTSGLTPLFTTPMPQANEPEAVKSLRELVHECENDAIVGWEDWIKICIERARAVLAGEPGAKDEQPSIDCLACAVRNAQLEQTPNSEVTAEYLDWLRTDCRSEGVGGNEAWNAGVAWARANSTAEQPKQAQAMYERELFHAWFDTYADPHSGRVERNIKRKAAWDAWQSRAALAQAQASGKAVPSNEEIQDAKENLSD